MDPRTLAQRLRARADTLVVGAGAAGVVVAARLSERSDHAVTLLDAGPDYASPEHLPDDLRDGTRNSMRAHDWGYTHRVNSVAWPNFPLPRGRVVGGSSMVNTCVALRGVPEDYDEWGAEGLEGWTWDACLPAFKRLETDLDVHDAHHGDDGPIPIRRHTRAELTPWQRGFVDACEALGLPRADDHNHPRATGWGPHPMNKLRGERMGAARCYLTPAVRARPNLTVVPRTLVRRVLFEGRRAVGVEVDRDGVVRTLLARRVVLCAGAIATPGILLRSGIGPSATVARLGVTLVRDNPWVARRLLDHPGAAFFVRPVAGVCDPSASLLQTALRFRSRGGDRDNDLQVQPGSWVSLPFVPFELVSIMCHVGKPRGTGLLTFPSPRADAAPVIRSRLLDDPHDRALAVEALQRGYEVAQAAPLRELGRVVWPPERVVSDAGALDGWIRRVCDSGYHVCGTVPMGRDDTRGAVDARGAVWGVEGLVVADASVMPTIPTPNIHLPTLMLGERFGAWLRDG